MKSFEISRADELLKSFEISRDDECLKSFEVFRNLAKSFIGFKRDDIDKLDVAMAPMRGLGRYSIVDAVPAGSGHAATLDQACA